MGFFDEVFKDVKKVFDKAPNIIGHGKKEEPGLIASATNSVVEKALWGVRKYYDLKIKAVNKVSDIEPEWEFFDVTTCDGRIQRVSNSILDAQKELESVKHDIFDYKSRMDAKVKEFRALKLKIREFQQSTDDNKRALIKHYEKDAQDIMVYIDDCENRINSLEQQQAMVESKIKKLMISKLSVLTLKTDSKSLEECRRISTRYAIKTPLATYGVDCLYKHIAGDKEGAYVCAENFYKAKSTEGANQGIEHPIIAFYLAQYFIKNNDFNRAEEHLACSIRNYPDNVVFHKLMLDIHIANDAQQKVQIEKDILELLA